MKHQKAVAVAMIVFGVVVTTIAVAVADGFTAVIGQVWVVGGIILSARGKWKA